MLYDFMTFFYFFKYLGRIYFFSIAATLEALKSLSSN